MCYDVDMLMNKKNIQIYIYTRQRHTHIARGGETEKQDFFTPKKGMCINPSQLSRHKPERSKWTWLLALVTTTTSKVEERISR